MMLVLPSYRQFRSEPSGGYRVLLDKGSAAQFASPGIGISVPDNSTTAIRASARDAAGNVSPCSSPFTYVESTP